MSSVSKLVNFDSTTAVPTPKNTSFSVVDSNVDVYVCSAGADLTVTLPSALLNRGRVLHFKLNVSTGNLLSGANNVKPITGAAVTNTIIPSGVAAGTSATLVSDGVNWVTVRYSVPA